MELRHLQALVAISEHGSFSAAADALGTVQSNVSAHVARLERELGTLVVDRSSGDLTPEGALVVARAYRLLGELDALTSDLWALREELAGTVRAGMIGTTTARWLVPMLIEDLSEKHPKLRLVVADGTTSGLGPQLAAGRYDLAVLTVPVPDHEITIEPLFEEDLVLVVPVEDDPLDGKTHIALADVARFELLLPAPGTQFRAEIDAALKPTGITLRARAELDGVRLLASLTFEGYGPAILPAAAVPPNLRDRFRLVAVDELMPRGVGLALRSRGMPSAPGTAHAVLASIRRIMATGDLPEGVHRTVPDALVRAEGALRLVGVPNG